VFGLIIATSGRVTRCLTVDWDGDNKAFASAGRLPISAALAVATLTKNLTFIGLIATTLPRQSDLFNYIFGMQNAALTCATLHDGAHINHEDPTPA
jgi:hypothetical protein